MLRLLFRGFCLPPRPAIFPGANVIGPAMKPSCQDSPNLCKDRANSRSVRQKISHWCSLLLVLACFLAAAVYMTASATAAQRAPAAHRPDAMNVIETYFRATGDYQSGDLITRSQIEKVLAKLKASGFKVNEAEEIAKLGLADDSFLARELSTAEGRQFMRKLAQHPGTFSHLDRLSTIPRGQSLVRDMIRQKDGDKLVEYLATTKGGKNMGSMMAQARGGVDLNKPTGRIYTVEDLIDALKAALSKTSP